ncbi:MAG: hypothetical protein ACFE9Q_00860 [Candidatus Hodarchaeota archaeon]
MVIQWTPYNKTNQWFEIFQKVRGKFPSFIKKWQTFTTVDEDRGIKGYSLVMVEKGKGDDAMTAIADLLVPFWKIEGFSMKIEPLYGMRDAIKALGKSL